MVFSKASNGFRLEKQIAAYKTYTNMPGYDLIATSAKYNTSARIQVKSRWRTGAPGFLIPNLDCEFVVVVKLNRGRKDGGGKVLAPEYFVFPVDVVKKARRDKGWRNEFFNKFHNLAKYRENWNQIADFLKNLPSAK